MSTILTPVDTITITIDNRTGAVNFRTNRNLPLVHVLTVMTSLMSHLLTQLTVQTPAIPQKDS